MSGKRNLFDADSDQDDDNLELTINKDYAKRYEEWREAEIKKKLEDRYGNADESLSSSSSDDDEDPEELRQVLSKDFFRVISSLKTKDPQIYNPEVQFFKNEKEHGGFDPLEKKCKKKEEKEKPVFLRDYERKLITERAGELSDDSDYETKQDPRSQSPSYVEEQRLLKESLKKALYDDNSDEEDDLLIKKEKTREEKLKEEEDYIEWLKGERDALPDKETEKSLQPLQNLWNDPKLDEGEKFLRDYVLNKKYLEKDDNPIDAGNLTDDDYQEEYMNQFERKYNFRFEEPDRDFLKRYPRTMEQSLRRKDTKRKEKREAVKQRKEEEKKKKKEELKVLKALKRKEILKKIEKIKAITGNDDLGINPDELEEDFDPDAHDRKMRELFNDDYYQGAEDAEDEDELNLPPLEEELLDDNMNWDEWDGTDKVNDEAAQENDTGYNGGPHCEDPDFNMDCEYDPAMESLQQEVTGAERKSARERRKLKRQSRFGRMVRKEKPVFNPHDKTFEQYVDEYYGMDYEDLIGDIPCRFKYKSVPANSFGLTIEEILAADDKELNQWASIKKAYTIRPDHVEKYEAKVYAQKAQDEELKRKILPSLYRQEVNSSNQVEELSKKKKKKNKNNNFQNDVTDETEVIDCGVNDPMSAGKSANKSDDFSKKKKKKKHPVNESENMTFYDPLINEDTSPASSKTKKKNKLRKSEQTNDVGTAEINATSDSPQDNVSNTLDSVKFEAMEKKKKKNKKHFDNPESTNGDNEQVHPHGVNPDASSNNVDAKKIKKRKRKDPEFDQDCKHPGKKARKINEQGEGSKKKFRKWNQDKKSGKKDQKVEISDERLKAYGIHPKKFKNKLKYGPQS